MKKSNTEAKSSNKNTGHFWRHMLNTANCCLWPQTRTILCLAIKTVQVQLMSLKLSAPKSKNTEEHVWLMLLVSVNTPSHLQSAETLVCLHCLAGCLTNTHTQTSRTEGKQALNYPLSFYTATHSVKLPDAQALTDCSLSHRLFFKQRMCFSTLKQWLKKCSHRGSSKGAHKY